MFTEFMRGKIDHTFVVSYGDKSSTVFRSFDKPTCRGSRACVYRSSIRPMTICAVSGVSTILALKISKIQLICKLVITRYRRTVSFHTINMNMNKTISFLHKSLLCRLLHNLFKYVGLNSK